MAPNDLTGHTLGQYTITSRLGRGGMADVYKAYHPKLEVHRAIKVIRPEFVTTEDFRERFQKEAQSVASLRHPNIVQIHDFGEQDDSYFMVMEFVEGKDLKRIIKDEGKIRPIRRALEIVDQVADALHYAHSRGLVHRDIKPENIMINEDGLPILMDFGIAKLLTAKTQLTQTGMGIGTPAYMAPEQAKALPEIGPTADIYSLSVVLYEMLTGQVPFSADTPMAVMLKAISDPMPMPRQFSGDISEELQQVILKGTAKDPGNRYSTARKFQQALRDVKQTEPEGPVEPASTSVMQTGGMEDQGQAAPAAGPAERSTEVRTEVRAKSGRTGLVLGVAVLLLAAAGGAAWYLLPPAGGPDRLAVDDGPAPADGARTPDGATEPRGPDGDETAEADGVSDERAVADAGDDGATPGTTEAAGDETVESGATTPAVVDGGAIGMDEPTRGSASAPGQAVSYAMDAEAGSTVYFDVAEDSAPAAYTLTAPDGGSRVFRTEGDHGPVTLEQSGTYTLQAEPRDGSGEFEFAVRALETPVIDGGAIALDQRRNGATDQAGQRVAYDLPAEAGQKVQFRVENATGPTEFTLMAPDGRTRVFQTRDDSGPVTLDQSGTYKLWADPAEDGVPEFAFVMREWKPPVTDGGVLRPGNFIRDSFRVPGRPVAYQLEGSAGQSLYLDYVDTQRSTRRIRFTLSGPGGEVFSSMGDHGPVTLDSAGTYRLLVDPQGNRSDAYEFVVWELDPPEVNGGALAFGQEIKGQTSVPGQTVSYSLRADAGQTILFDHGESTEATNFTLTAPDGQTRVFRTKGDFGPVTLGQSGTYTLVADPEDDWVSKFDFVVRPAGPSG